MTDTTTAHSCDNCDGIDPATCLANPNRPRKTTTETPTAMLRRAADRLEETAAAGTPGRWEARELPPNQHKQVAHWVTTKEDDSCITSQMVADCPWRQADARYIATVYPQAGLAVAELLRAVADTADGLPGGQDTAVVQAAMATARAILDEEA